MAPKLYYLEASPPVRAVLLTAKALGLELDLKPLDLLAGEHLKPDFIKINPQHTVPTLVDNSYILWESHAICAYLVSKYGKNDSLYPKDLQKRGTVDQRLHFDSSVLQAHLLTIVRPIIRDGVTTIPKEKVANMTQAYDFLEAFLEGKNYLAGDHVTIADLAMVATLSSIVAFVPLNKEKHSRLHAWFKRLQALPYYQQANQAGVDQLTKMVQSKLSRE